jgi:hypothetical protein
MPKTFLNYKGATLASVYETDEIVANPTLEGTEQPLAGLQVGNTKFSVSQGGGYSPNVFCTVDLLPINGKHLSVDNLIAFLNSKNITTGDNLEIGEVGGNERVIQLYYGSSTYISIGDESIIYITFDTDYETTLLNAKTTIESTPVTVTLNNGPKIFTTAVINNDGGTVTTAVITLQEILNLFED